MWLSLKVHHLSFLEIQEDAKCKKKNCKLIASFICRDHLQSWTLWAESSLKLLLTSGKPGKDSAC